MKESEAAPGPQRLEYRSRPLSPYDRPVEPFVTFARRLRFAMRIGYLVFALLVVALAVWGGLRMAGLIDRYSQ